MFELPFNRKGRLKNANLDEFLLLVRNSFIVGRLVAEGKRLMARRTTSMAASLYVRMRATELVALLDTYVRTFVLPLGGLPSADRIIVVFVEQVFVKGERGSLEGTIGILAVVNRGTKKSG